MLGNVTTDRFSDLWNSEKMHRIREQNVSAPGSFALCKGCNYQHPRKHTMLTDLAQCLFNMNTLARILYARGYTRKSQI
jgi:hypothetical protein